MGSFSIWHWLIVLAVILLLFGGRGKVSQLMSDFGKGLKSFKQSMKDDENFEDKATAQASEPKSLPGDTARPKDAQAEKDRVTRP